MRTTIAAILAGLVTSLSASAAPELLNGISVIVNNEVITEQQIEVAIAPQLRSLALQYRSQPQVLQQRAREIRSDRVEGLVQSQLILADFKSQGFQLPEAYVEDYIDDQIREEFGDNLNFARTLKELGQTREQFREERKNQLIERLLRQRMLDLQKIVISPTRIEAYYQQNLTNYQQGDMVKLRMISINQPAGAPKGMAKKIADEVHAKLLDGAPFAQMASIYSDGAARTTGGSRDWVGRNFLNKELTEVAFNLKPGELSPVVDLPGGAYILYVEEARINYTRPLAEVQEEIETRLRQDEQARIYRRWIERLKSKNFVRYF